MEQRGNAQVYFKIENNFEIFILDQEVNENKAKGLPLKIVAKKGSGRFQKASK